MGFHVAVIPDGNRRWARARGLPSLAGHEAGSHVLESLLTSEVTREIGWFTFWAASVDNLTKRPPEEVAFLNQLFTQHLRELAHHPTIHEHRIRVRVLGEWQTYLTPSAQEAAHEAMAATAYYSGRTLSLLVAYDGIRDLVAAVERITAQARSDPALVVSAALLKGSLLTAELPAVDLVIRTGGEPHWSAGFLMWEIANAQLMFSDRLWPDFTAVDLAGAIAAYRTRERRFGA